jgi:hypothetical protein
MARLAPDFRPLGRRRGRRASPSLAGGLELLWLSWASRRLSAAFSASNSRT